MEMARQRYGPTRTSGLFYKSFTIVIYNCNDSSQYYNSITMIVSYAPNLTLALASVVNYDRKWRSKLRHNYDRKTFKVQATGSTPIL
jgi:hypothetical protein